MVGRAGRGEGVFSLGFNKLSMASLSLSLSLSLSVPSHYVYPSCSPSPPFLANSCLLFPLPFSLPLFLSLFW